MVKGVTRRIVEIRETGNSYFERAIFFVRMESHAANESSLSEEARRIIDRYASDVALSEVGGRRRRLLRRIFYGLTLLGAAAAGALAALLAAHVL